MLLHSCQWWFNMNEIDYNCLRKRSSNLINIEENSKDSESPPPPPNPFFKRYIAGPIKFLGLSSRYVDTEYLYNRYEQRDTIFFL